jgi:hypothetical protein
MQAVKALAKLDVNGTAAAIRSRLTDGPEKFGLPPLQPQEDRVDIFVQVYEYGNNGEVRRRLSAGCVLLLDDRSLGLWELGEVSYLSARIQASNAIGPLLRIARELRWAPSLAENSLVRMLGSLVGLLGAVKDISPQTALAAKEVFESCLNLKSCTFLAVTGLVGLWPEDRERLLAEVAGLIDEERLDVNLTVAGFLPLETLEARWPKAVEEQLPI